MDAEQIKLLVEYKRRREHVVNTYKAGDIDGWNQKSFHASEARYRLLFGGNQSGKSHTNAYELVCWLTGKHPYRRVPTPPNIVWAISTEYITLQSGIYRHINNMLPDWLIAYIGPKIPQQQLPTFIELKNGSQIWFKSAKGDDGARQKFQAEAVDLISIDEEISHSIWEELQARTIITGGQFIISATLVESYDWITNLERLAEAAVIKGETSKYFLTRLNTKCNPHADPVVLEELEEMWSDEEKNVRFKGLSRRASGLVYSRWESERNECDDFPIPREWPRWCAIDPGYRTFACLWIAVGPDNKAYAYRELYLQNETLWRAALEIKTLEGWELNKDLSDEFSHYVWDPTDRSEDMVTRFIDDKEGSKLITGEEGVHSQLYNRYGISATPANKAVQPGIEDVRWWIENGFKCFRSCVNFLEERRNYVIKPPKSRKSSDEPQDRPVKKRDHLMDCLRYIARDQPKWADRVHLPNYKENPYTAESYAKRIAKRREAEEYHEFVGEW